MKVRDLIEQLMMFPEDMEVRIITPGGMQACPLSVDNLLHTSETAYVNTDAPEDTWDCEDGKIELGPGKQYLLINADVI